MADVTRGVLGRIALRRVPACALPGVPRAPSAAAPEPRRAPAFAEPPRLPQSMLGAVLAYLADG